MKPGVRVLLRYALLQIPGLAFAAAVAFLAGDWLGWPLWVRWGIVLLWALKDLALFPLTWRAYCSEGSSPAKCLVGRRGVARERLSPRGYVLLGGELWLAELDDDSPPVEKDGAVRVLSLSGLTLLVEAEKEAEPL